MPIVPAPAMLPPSTTSSPGPGLGNVSPSPSSTFTHLTPTKPSASTMLHHPQARTSVTDALFPTVLDDAVEALSSGSDVFVVSPSRTGSPSALSGGRRTYSTSAGSNMSPSRETSPSAGTRSPGRSPIVEGVMLSDRERRSSAVSLTGQAGKMLDVAGAGETSQGFRLTMPGQEVSRS